MKRNAKAIEILIVQFLLRILSIAAVASPVQAAFADAKLSLRPKLSRASAHASIFVESSVRQQSPPAADGPTNVDNYDADGVAKKGARKWKYSSGTKSSVNASRKSFVLNEKCAGPTTD